MSIKELGGLGFGAFGMCFRNWPRGFWWILGILPTVARPSMLVWPHDMLTPIQRVRSLNHLTILYSKEILKFVTECTNTHLHNTNLDVIMQPQDWSSVHKHKYLH